MVIYFSGTGNSRYAALRIAKNLNDEAADLLPLIREKDHSPLYSESPWVLAAPVYAWRLPRIVQSWMEKTPLNGSKDIYFVLTCGDEIGNAEKYARRLAERKGMNFKGIKAVIMPENYIAMFNAPDEEKSREIVKRAEPVIDAVSDMIKRGENVREKTGMLDRIKSSAVNTVFYPLFISDRKFRTLESCTGCARCTELCPLNNITMENGRPKWGGSCTHCMACICRCPAEAIEYGSASTGKPRYKCPE